MHLVLRLIILAAAAGTRDYPRQYGSNAGQPSACDTGVLDVLNAIPCCEKGQASMEYFEFLLTDPVIIGGAAQSQGKDRVIAVSPNPGQGGTRTFTCCMVLTHRGGTGSEDSRLFPCT